MNIYGAITEYLAQPRINTLYVLSMPKYYAIKHVSTLKWQILNLQKKKKERY